MYKTKLVHRYDVVPNLVVEIEIFNFCFFVCLHVCLYLKFCQFHKRKMQCDEPARINTGTPVFTGVLRKSPVKQPYFCDFARKIASPMALNAHLLVISCLNEVFRAPWQQNESDDNNSKFFQCGSRVLKKVL